MQISKGKVFQNEAIEKCKGPGARTGTLCSRNRKTSVTRASEQMGEEKAKRWGVQGQ